MLQIAERVLFIFAGALSASLVLLIMSGVGAVFFGVFDKLCLFVIRLGDPLRRLVGKSRYETILHPGSDAIIVGVEDVGPRWTPMAKIGLVGLLILFGVGLEDWRAARQPSHVYRPVEYVVAPPIPCKPTAPAQVRAEAESPR